jgi:hypothetical protein
MSRRFIPGLPCVNAINSSNNECTSTIKIKCELCGLSSHIPCNQKIDCLSNDYLGQFFNDSNPENIFGYYKYSTVHKKCYINVNRYLFQCISCGYYRQMCGPGMPCGSCCSEIRRKIFISKQREQYDRVIEGSFPEFIGLQPKIEIGDYTAYFSEQAQLQEATKPMV